MARLRFAAMQQISVKLKLKSPQLQKFKECFGYLKERFAGSVPNIKTLYVVVGSAEQITIYCVLPIIKTGQVKQ